MTAAGIRAVYSIPVVLRSEVSPSWNSCSLGRVVGDLKRKEIAKIPPSDHRQRTLPLPSFASVAPNHRRLSSAHGIRFRKGSQVFDTEDDQADSQEGASEGSQEVGAGQEGGEREEGWDLSWLPSLPHVATAAMANFLFGYHIGIINGPLDAIARELNFEGDTLAKGFVVSIFIVGAFVGCISGGVLSDVIGRRRTFQICAIPLVIGAALSANANSVEAMVLGRLLVGVGIGVNTALVPLYISEIAPTKFRGALGSGSQIGICTGIIMALLLGIPSETDPHWWRTLFWLGPIPAGLLIAGMQFCVESPRWLGKMGRWKEASSTFEKLWGKEQVEEAMEELRDANKAQEEEASWGELFSKRYIKVASIGGTLFALQQLSGINGIIYFSSSNFLDAGVTNSIAASALVGLANLAGALVSSSLMDSQGRKKSLMGSFGGMAISIAMLVAALNIPMDEQLSHGLTVIGTLTYVFTFNLGAGPVIAVIIPEMSSTRIRAKVLAFSLCVHWVFNFGIGLTFLELVQRFGISAVYSTFGVVSLFCIFFANSAIVETKGRSLEEIELLLNSGGEAKQ